MGQTTTQATSTDDRIPVNLSFCNRDQNPCFTMCLSALVLPVWGALLRLGRHPHRVEYITSRIIARDQSRPLSTKHNHDVLAVLDGRRPLLLRCSRLSLHLLSVCITKATTTPPKKRNKARKKGKATLAIGGMLEPTRPPGGPSSKGRKGGGLNPLSRWGWVGWGGVGHGGPEEAASKSWAGRDDKPMVQRRRRQPLPTPRQSRCPPPPLSPKREGWEGGRKGVGLGRAERE